VSRVAVCSGPDGVTENTWETKRTPSPGDVPGPASATLIDRPVGAQHRRKRACDRRVFGTLLTGCNVRYVMFHMIQETARHAGHADIIRETVDGSRGI
jgi:hypothetical protein